MTYNVFGGTLNLAQSYSIVRLLLFVSPHRCFTDVQSADDGILIDGTMLPIRCCIVVL